MVRIKDRLTNPLDSGNSNPNSNLNPNPNASTDASPNLSLTVGYRDILLNLKIKGVGYDMIMELQLHLKDIIALVRR